MIEDMTINELSKLLSVLNTGAASSDDSHWEVGKCYFIRCVTYHQVGRLKKVTPTELVLENASWVADSGRFGEALKTGSLSEVEHFGGDAVIGRGAIVDATLWMHPLPTKTT